MAIIVEKSRKPIISKGIKVYKILTPEKFCLRTPIYNREWIMGREYETKLVEANLSFSGAKPKEITHKYINQGFYSFQSLNQARDMMNRRLKNASDLGQHPDYHIYECTIPSGGEYFISTAGEVASNKLIVNKIII